LLILSADRPVSDFLFFPPAVAVLRIYGISNFTQWRTWARVAKM
jgi:hypothetical protein